MPQRQPIRPTRTARPARNRMRYAALALAVVASGLLWRFGLIPLPGWLANTGGDALWALMVFVGFGFVFPRTSTAGLAISALAFSWAVECSQLYHAPWLDALRTTTPGKLTLGNTFLWQDMAAYAVGIALGTVAEMRWHR